MPAFCVSLLILIIIIVMYTSLDKAARLYKDVFGATVSDAVVRSEH